MESSPESTKQPRPATTDPSSLVLKIPIPVNVTNTPQNPLNATSGMNLRSNKFKKINELKNDSYEESKKEVLEDLKLLEEQFGPHEKVKEIDELIDPKDSVDLKEPKDLQGIKESKGEKEMKNTKYLIDEMEDTDNMDVKALKDMKEVKEIKELTDFNEYSESKKPKKDKDLDELQSFESKKEQRAGRLIKKCLQDEDFVYNEEINHFVSKAPKKNQKKKKIQKKPLLKEMQNVGEETNKNICICGDPQENSNMIQCDKCNQWLHFKCAGLNESSPNEFIDKQFFCLTCLTSPINSKKHGIKRVKPEEDELKNETGLSMLISAAQNSEIKKHESGKSAFVSLKPSGVGKPYAKAIKKDNFVYLVPKLSLLESLKGAEPDLNDSIILKNISRNFKSRIKENEKMYLDNIASKIQYSLRGISNLKEFIKKLNELVKDANVKIPLIYNRSLY